jgi:tetratricopeptide (TPR) repeat protein
MAPPAERLKLNRKALREPDEFQTLTGQAAAWAQANRTLLMGAAAAVLVIGAVALGVGWYRGRQSAAAAVRFQGAHDDFQAGRYTAAADAFAGLAGDFRGTPFGRIASLYRGHALARQADAAAAATAYTEYLAASPDTEYLRQEALTGLGEARAATGDTAGALDALGQAAAIDGPFRTQARLAMARLHESAGQADKAKELYLAILAESPSGFVRSVLEAKIPTEVAGTGGEGR